MGAALIYGADGHGKGNKTFAPLYEHTESCINTVLLQDSAVGYLKLLLWSTLVLHCYHMLNVNAEIPGKNKGKLLEYSLFPCYSKQPV
jgi:hypothetical protein